MIVSLHFFGSWSFVPPKQFSTKRNHGQHRKSCLRELCTRANICRTISIEIASLQKKFFPVPRLPARVAPPNL